LGNFFGRVFLFAALARLFGFLFLPLKNPFQLKQKSNVPFVGWTKSMTEKITEGSA